MIRLVIIISHIQVHPLILTNTIGSLSSNLDVYSGPWLQCLESSAF